MSEIPPAAREPRCSECGRPFVAEPCGLMHAVARVQIGLLRSAFANLLKGDQRV